MKLSALKKEILLVLLWWSNGGKRLAPLTANMLVNNIKEIRSSSFKSPHVKPLNFVCVQRSLKRLLKDGLVNIDTSRNPSLYWLTTRGTRKAKEIETEICNYVYKWWKFVKK